MIPLARAVNVPVVVDAAYMRYPTRWITFYGDPDLVCLRAKYFWGPHVGGYDYGREELIQPIAQIDFTGFESAKQWTFGRSYKLHRTSVVTTALALEEWLEMDHKHRCLGYRDEAEEIRLAAAGAAGAAGRPWRCSDASPCTST